MWIKALECPELIPRVNTLTPRSLARHPGLWVQAVSSFSLYFSYQNTYFSSLFYLSILLEPSSIIVPIPLTSPSLSLSIPVPRNFPFSTVPVTHCHPAHGSDWAPACCKWVHRSPDEQFLLPVFIPWLFTWGSIALLYIQRQTLFLLLRAELSRERHERRHCTDKRQHCWQLPAYKLSGRVQRKWEMFVETKLIYCHLLLACLLKNVLFNQDSL